MELRKNKNLFRYRGNSMWPLFQEGDLLVVKKVSQDELLPGDCVVYRKTSQENFIAHRIVASQPQIITRGDFIAANDREPVLFSDIEGRVIGRIRYRTFHRVSNGVKGVWQGRFYRYAGLLEPTRHARGGQVAKFIRKSLNCFSFLWQSRLSFTSFTSADGCSKRYLLLGSRCVGTYKKESRAWTISWPCSLFLNPNCLKASPGTRQRYKMS